MRVKWKEDINVPEEYWDRWDSYTYKEYSGKIIDTRKTLFHTYLIVACDDLKIREIEISQVKWVKKKRVIK